MQLYLGFLPYTTENSVVRFSFTTDWAINRQLVRGSCQGSDIALVQVKDRLLAILLDPARSQMRR